jgi:hypothetical protein
MLFKDEQISAREAFLHLQIFSLYFHPDSAGEKSFLNNVRLCHICKSIGAQPRPELYLLRNKNMNIWMFSREWIMPSDWKYLPEET